MEQEDKKEILAKNRSYKVLEHPDSEEIIKRLQDGESVKNIEALLKKRYPRQKRNHIGFMSLQKFRKEVLNINKELIEDIRQTKRDLEVQGRSENLKLKLSQSNAYQEKLKEIVNKELDTKSKLLEAVVLISSRVEYYFNMINENPDLRSDKMLIDLLNAQRGFIQDYEKYINGAADKTIEHNVHISVVNEQLTIFKNIIFDVLQDMSPNLIPIFVDKINKKMKDVQFGNEKYEEYTKIPALDVIDAD